MPKRSVARTVAVAFALALLTACGAGTPAGVSPSLSQATALRAARSGTGAGKIQHVVFIVQENRSFDNLFQGYPGADTQSWGKNSKGDTIQLRPMSLARAYEIDHSAHAMFTACDGTGTLPGTKCRMDSFDKEQAFLAPPNPQFVYVPHNQSKPYFDMAHEWVLADRMFQSQLDESFVAHQYVIAAQAQSSVDLPDGKWGCEGGSSDIVQMITDSRVYGGWQQACFDYQTLGDELDGAKLTWRFYTSKYTSPNGGEWSGYQAVKHIFDGPDWSNVITPQKKFLTDVAAGTLDNFTWITPTCKNSDHIDCGSATGPSWVTALVNAVGESQFWDSTAIFVIWDDWGGLYDHVPPPYRGYDGVGFRVPMLVISPYARKNFVSHKQYETASVLRFAENLFNLGQLSQADARATSPAQDCFDFTKPPRAFGPIKAPKGAQYFLHQAPDFRIPDEQ
ncbi:MAG TPA: alkaline phosphatase family protein [Candidatus Binatia bacterium]|nr:alkaline phosphatase family protein [Candidatus Binatia bacterium]